MNAAERKQAWKQAKAAVRAYSRDPSENNAMTVENAWRKIRRMDSVSFWREWQTARLSAPGFNGEHRVDAPDGR